MNVTIKQDNHMNCRNRQLIQTSIFKT